MDEKTWKEIWQCKSYTHKETHVKKYKPNSKNCNHQWDNGDGERCIKCGIKDWMLN